MSSVYHKWLHSLFSKRVHGSYSAPGDDDSAVELTGFARPAAKELLDLSTSRPQGAEITRLCTVAHDVNAELQLHQHRGISKEPSRHDSNGRIHAPSAGGSTPTHIDAVCNEVNDELGVSGRGQQDLQHEAIKSLQQHWQGEEPNVRLLLSILLEHLRQHQQAFEVDGVLYSRSWQDVCQLMVDTVALCTILEYYFPGSIDSAASAEHTTRFRVGSRNPTTLGAESCRSARSASVSRPHDAIEQPVACCPASQKLLHPLADPVADSGGVAEQPLQTQQQLQRDLAEGFLVAAAEAGVQLPVSCDVDSIVSSNVDSISQLLLAVVTVGEVKQHLSAKRMHCLSVLYKQQQQQLLKQQNQSASVQSSQFAGGSTLKKNTSDNVCPDTVPLSQQTSGVAGTTGALVQAWLKFIAQQSCDSESSNQRELVTSLQVGARQQAGANSPLQAGDVQQQGAVTHSITGAATLTKITWQRLVTVLLHLQNAHDSCSQLQQAQQSGTEQQACTPAYRHPTSTSGLHNHPSGDALQQVSVCEVTAADASTGASQGLLLQQLQQLGCDPPLLLQQDDLVNDVLQGSQHPNALQLVLLLRLLGSTSDLWLPAVEAAVSHAKNLEETDQSLPNKLKLPCPELQHTGQHSSSVSLDSESPRTIDEQQSVFDDGSTGGVTSPRDCWPPELLTQTHLWPGDEEDTDAAAMTREERTLRRWINSVLHRNSTAAAAGGDDKQGFIRRLSRASSDAPVQYSSVMKQGSCSIIAEASAVALGDGGVASFCSQPTPRHSSSSAAGIYETDSTDINNLDLLNLATAYTGQAEAEKGSGSIAEVSQLQFGVPPVVSATESPRDSLSAPAAATATAVVENQAVTGESARRSSTSSAAAHSSADGPSIHFSFNSISSLFGAEIRSGVLLLELLEHLQPGCVDWKLANRLPFKGVGIAPQLQALENCQLALKVAQDDLGLPLVSISARDVVLGRRKLILALVYQLMRYHTMQMLESIAAVQQRHRKQGPCQATSAVLPAVVGHATGVAANVSQESPSVTPRAMSRVRMASSSKKQRKGRQIEITEDDILAWANGKLEHVQSLPLQTPYVDMLIENNGIEAGWLERPPVVKSFKDPIMSSGVVLLQLLHVMRPDAVDLSYVSPGVTLEQRQSNAKYALSVAKKIGCSLFLVWEDLIDLQPKLLLVLLASLMFLDLTSGQ